MAKKKISALPPMTELGSDDVFPAVDDSAGSTKKTPLSLLLSWLQSISSWISANNINLSSLYVSSGNLSAVTLSGSEQTISSIDTTGLPTGKYKIDAMLRVSDGGNSGNADATLRAYSSSDGPYYSNESYIGGQYWKTLNINTALDFTEGDNIWITIARASGSKTMTCAGGRYILTRIA